MMKKIHNLRGFSTIEWNLFRFAIINDGFGLYEIS